MSTYTALGKTATYTLSSNKIPVQIISNDPEVTPEPSESSPRHPPQPSYRHRNTFATTGPRFQHLQIYEGDTCEPREELSPASFWLADSYCILRQEERRLRPTLTRFLHAHRLNYLVRTYTLLVSLARIRATDLYLAFFIRQYIRYRSRRRIRLSDPAARSIVVFKRAIYWKWRHLLRKLLSTRTQLARIRSLRARFHNYWWARATPIGEREAAGSEIFEEYLQARLRHDHSTTFF